MSIFRIISDLHTELWPENPRKARTMIDVRLPPLPDDNRTTLLLAGDTGSHRRRNLYAAVIAHLCDRFERVIDIPGNHFWYGGTDWTVDTAAATAANYVFGSTLTDGEVVAATLWADFRKGNPLVELACVEGMNDFKQIPGLTPDLVKARHAEHLEFLRANIRPGCVVMTHFAPSWRSIPEHFVNDPRNGYYASDMDLMVEDLAPAIWLHGHIHTACDYLIGSTRVICNPAGYEGRDHNPMLAFES
jgi:hypothetical protein